MILPIICTVAVLLLLLILIASNYLVSFSLDTKSRFFVSKQHEKKGIDFTDPDFAPNHKWLEDETQIKTITSKDGLKLCAYSRIIDPESEKTALIIHGYGGNPEEMVPFAKHYTALGYNCYIPNQRSHGLSQGRYISMGYNESKDMLLWLNLILEENPKTQIVVHGVSMGAATTMMLSGMDIPDNVKVCVEDCGYNSISGIFSDKLNHIFHLPSFPFIQLGSVMCKMRAGFFYNSGNSIKSIKKSKLPMAFIHGRDDDFIPLQMMEEVYAACPNDKVKLIVDGAKHAKSQKTNPDLYWSTVDPFVQKYIK